MRCPECGQKMAGVKYAPDDPNYFDGVSEWFCIRDQLRIGRWSKRRLTGDDSEPRYGPRKPDENDAPIREPTHRRRR